MQPPERTPPVHPYTHFVTNSIVFLTLFVNSKVGLRGSKLCVPLLTETEKWL